MSSGQTSNTGNWIHPCRTGLFVVWWEIVLGVILFTGGGCFLGYLIGASHQYRANAAEQRMLRER